MMRPMLRVVWIVALVAGCGASTQPGPTPSQDGPPLPACPSDTSPAWACVTPPGDLEVEVDDCPATASLETRLGPDEAAEHAPAITRWRRASGGSACCYLSCRPLAVQTQPAPGSCEGGLEPATVCVPAPGFTSSSPAEPPYEVCPVAVLRGQGAQWEGIVGGLYFDAGLTSSHDGDCCYRGCREP